MSYQVLARKWRPTKFAELVGQTHVKSALVNGLSNQRLHHAYLFTGTRGVGKTSIARIFAKSLNCETGVSAEPCGQCGTCVDVDSGRFVDLIEIDAASRTKVGDTREILDNVQYAPTRGRYKIYLIDEVHMLSRHSFNALLKTLEEPPEHVKFLLATTDPQKLPVTILSRCLQFNLQALAPEQIARQLELVLSNEQLPFEPEAVSLLAKFAKGSMRDALSLTDQAIAQSGLHITLASVQAMMGTVDVSWSQNLLAAILNQDAAELVEVLTRLAQQAPDVEKVLDDLLTICHQVALTQVMPSAAKLNEANREFIQQVAQQLKSEDVQVYYQLLLQGKKDIHLATDPTSGFEMVCLRLLAFKPADAFSIDAPELKKNSELKASSPATVSANASLDQKEASRDPQESASSISKIKAQVQSDNSPVPVEPLLTEQSNNTVAPAELQSDSLSNPEHDNNLDSQHKEQGELQGEKSNESSNGVDKDSDSDSQFVTENVSQTTSATDTDQSQVSTEFTVAAEQNQPSRAPKDSQEEQELLAQQAFYQELAENQGFAAPEDYQSMADDYYASAEPTFAPEPIDKAPEAEVTPLPQHSLQSGSEQDNPVLAILASRGIDPNDKPVFASKPEAPADAAEDTQEVEQEVQAEPDVEVELKPIEHEEVRFAHEVDQWAQLIERSNLAGLGRQLALNGSVEIHGDKIELTVKQEFAHLLNDKSEQELIEVVRQLSPATEFVINKSEITEMAPSDIQKNINQNRQERAEQSIHQDPVVQSLLTEFDGKIVADSILPL